MQPALSLPPRPDAAALASMLPILHWDGNSPTGLIGPVEARLAAGARFVVIARCAPLGRPTDRGFLAGWWRTARPRLGGLCAGWAVLQTGGDPVSIGDFTEFPIRRCADTTEAIGWLRARLVTLDDLLAPPVVEGILNLN